MNWTVQQKIRAGFWLLAFLPVVLGILAGRNALELAASTEHLATTNETSRRLEKLFSDVKDLEVAQREYILIGNADAVAAVSRSEREIAQDLSELRNLRKRGNQDTWMAHLENLIPEKLDEIHRTIETRNASGPDAASQVLLANRGSQAMDSIRTVVRHMIAEESRLLQERQGEQRRRFYGTLELFAVVLLLNVALIAILYILQRRESERAREVNEELERRVALRTEALQRSNEDLQQFAYIASHDLKEPLRMISSYTTLLQRRYAGRLDGDADTFITFIVEGVRRMNTLIQDLLEYSRAGAGKDEQLTDVDVRIVLRNVIDNLKVTIAEAGGSVRWDELPKTVPYDAIRLTQIFQNLISNAMKYRGNRRPEVRISAVEHADEVVFSVRDNGIGIEPEYIDKIFGIFQRLHSTEYEGTGIGLAMVKMIVERHGGRIWVESTPGQGSTFSFTVPSTVAQPETEALSTSTI